MTNALLRISRERLKKHTGVRMNDPTPCSSTRGKKFRNEN